MFEHGRYELARRGPTHRACSWCAGDVPIHHRPGRPRLYCAQACRQRAYEHRHGLRHERTQRRLPGQTEHEFTPSRPGQDTPDSGLTSGRTGQDTPDHGLTPGRSGQGMPERRPPSGTGYERGGHGFGDAIVHALRPCVRPEGRRRETLCGLLAAPSGNPFSTMHRTACRTCSAVALRHPLRVRIEPSNELARLRAIIEETEEHRHNPAAALAWIVADHPDRRTTAA